MLQNATPLRKSAPGPPNISDEHVSYTAPATENASLQILFKCPTSAIVFGNDKTFTFCSLWQGSQSLAPATQNDICWTSKNAPNPPVFCTFDFEMCFAPQRRALFRHHNFKKWSKPGVLCAFWFRNVLRATTACTFSTSQLPKVVRTWCVLLHFDFEMCFVPQRRALFRHLNFKKRSGVDVLCTFWLRNVLRATAACTFSTSQLQKVVQTWCVLCILIAKCASRHNDVQLSISHLASWLRTRRSSEPTFRPSGTKSLEKHSVSRLSDLFAHLDLLSSETSSFWSLLLLFSSLTLPISAFHLSILSEVWLLNFLRSFSIISHSGRKERDACYIVTLCCAKSDLVDLAISLPSLQIRSS